MDVENSVSQAFEIFKEVPGFSDYEVSNYGRVRTRERYIRYTHAVTGEEHFRKTTERLLKVYFNNLTGYKFVQLYLNKKSKNKNIHRLVAETFLDKAIGLDYVNHKDGNKHNNAVGNLEWCTNEYNHEHAKLTGLIASGSRVGTSVLTERCIYAIKKMLSDGFSHGKIADFFGVTRSTITLINTGKTWNNALTGEELQIKEV